MLGLPLCSERLSWCRRVLHARCPHFRHTQDPVRGDGLEEAPGSSVLRVVCVGRTEWTAPEEHEGMKEDGCEPEVY